MHAYIVLFLPSIIYFLLQYQLRSTVPGQRRDWPELLAAYCHSRLKTLPQRWRQKENSTHTHTHTEQSEGEKEGQKKSHRVRNFNFFSFLFLFFFWQTILGRFNQFQLKNLIVSAMNAPTEERCSRRSSIASQPRLAATRLTIVCRVCQVERVELSWDGGAATGAGTGAGAGAS